MKNDLMIYSIFTSINGEVCCPGQGSLATFIRFAGCNLRCKWCDTTYALEPESGTPRTIAEIVDIVKKNGLKNITITGGEPLMQTEGFRELAEELWFARYNISVETNGSIEIPFLKCVLNWVIDIKPQSAEAGNVNPHPENDMFKRLKESDWIKFVVSNQEDYDDAVKYCRGLRAAGCRANMAFSPNTDSLDTNQLVEWMKQTKLRDVVVNVQLHKIIDLSEPD